MTDQKLLKSEIDASGVTITHIAQELGCSRNRVYAILNGAECNASEIVGISKILHLALDTRDAIFLPEKVSEAHG